MIIISSDRIIQYELFTVSSSPPIPVSACSTPRAAINSLLFWLRLLNLNRVQSTDIRSYSENGCWKSQGKQWIKFSTKFCQFRWFPAFPHLYLLSRYCGSVHLSDRLLCFLDIETHLSWTFLMLTRWQYYMYLQFYMHLKHFWSFHMVREGDFRFLKIMWVEKRSLSPFCDYRWRKQIHCQCHAHRSVDQTRWIWPENLKLKTITNSNTIFS